MKLMRRLMRHLFTTTAAGRRAFPPHALKAIQAAIATGETLHRGEIRLVVEPAMSAADLLRRTSSRERARELFAEYCIWDTEENTGVLIYVNLADHKVEIVADRGVDRRIDASTWQEVCRTMTSGFAQGNYHESTITAITKLNELLTVHFPANDAQPNELSNRPLIL